MSILYQIIQYNGVNIIEFLPSDEMIQGERDMLDLFAETYDADTNRILLSAANLPPAFYDLKTGLAGEVLQKFSTYSIRAAAVLTPELVGTGRFREMVVEANRSSTFRVYFDREAALEWLSS
jgi:PadR family transcriptional regulator, regulatory protein AphA